MRKVFLLMLLASAASPALAGPNDSENRGFRGHRAEKSQSDGDSQRSERPSRPERSYQPQQNSSRPDSGGRSNGNGTFTEPQPNAFEGHARKAEHAPSLPERPAVETPSAAETHVRKSERPTLPDRPDVERHVQPAETSDTVRNWRGTRRDGPAENSTIEDRNVRVPPNSREGGPLVEPRRDTPHVVQPSERRVSRRPMFGTEPPAPSTANTRHAHPNRHWNTDWRRDHRYDWNDWRRRHRSRFHIGFYYDPFGWDYFRYGLGWRMWPSYYGSSFWLNDPWYYRLPPAYGPYRWVRYHHDAVLVNIYTGQIADIIYNFFW
ncbi:hypothetical protein GCM10023264_19810 [Sphingomonas daechungensis]